MTNEMVERLTGSLWMVTKPGTDMNCLGRVYRDKGTAFTHKDYDETVVELRLADAHEPLPCALTQATLDGLIAEADKYILPVDVKMGAATFRKGVKVGTMLRGLKVHAERQTATAFSPGASRDASPPYHVDATGMTREPPHCPTCDCGTPADLVGALQDVVHTDPGPVRAGKAVRDAASKKWSVERLGIIKQTPRQASIDDIEWLCEEVERLQAGILYEVENASLAPSARIRMRTLAIGTHESEKPGYHCEKLKADCDDEFCPTHGHDIR